MREGRSCVAGAERERMDAMRRSYRGLEVVYICRERERGLILRPREDDILFGIGAECAVYVGFGWYSRESEVFICVYIPT